MPGAVWDVGVGVATVAAASAAVRWAKRRCDEAIACARLLPAPAERSFALIAGLDDRSVDRAQLREQRALQEALDNRVSSHTLVP